jgi:hypothetical protein
MSNESDTSITQVRFRVLTAASMKMTVFWDVATCSLVEVYRRFRGAYCDIALMMEAESTSETSVNFYQTTRRNNPEDSHLHTHRREKNLKYHNDVKSLYVLKFIKLICAQSVFEAPHIDINTYT